MTATSWKTYGPFPGRATVTVKVQFAPDTVLTDPVLLTCTGVDPNGAAVTLTSARLSVGTYAILLDPTTYGPYKLDIVGLMPSGKTEAQSIVVLVDTTAS